MILLKPLYLQWSKFFEDKIQTEFNFDKSASKNYQIDAAPLIYCCLHHRRVPVKNWNVVLSKEFLDSNWKEDIAWLKIKDKLENGEDINSFMSKKINDWTSIDFLLYTFNIYHFHLYRDSNGGIRDQLVFGTFHNDNFYILGISGHNDLYNADKWINIILHNWENEKIFKNIKTIKNLNSKFNSKEFKKIANNPNLQYNLVEPIQHKKTDNSIISLHGHQHTNSINFTLNGISYKKTPIQAYCAYINEIEYLNRIEEFLIRKYGFFKRFKLDINIEQKIYIITINNFLHKKEFFSFHESMVICSSYASKNYYPYKS